MHRDSSLDSLANAPSAIGALAAALVAGVVGAFSAGGEILSAEARAESQHGGAVRAFFSTHCYECHQGEDAEAGLNLEALGST